MRLKYIIFGHQGEEVPVVFPADIMHKAMMIHDHLNGRAWPVSAGFCEMDSSGVLCFGESESLKLKSRPAEDAAIIFDYYKPS